MSMTSSSHDYSRFDELAEEFAERYRRGERPSLQEYVDRLPEMADEIREMFPALVAVEQAEGEARGDPSPPPSAAPRPARSGITGSCGKSAGVGWVWFTRPIRSRWAAAWRSRSCPATSRATARRWSDSAARRRPRPGYTTPTSCRSSKSAREGDLAFYAMQLIQGQGLDLVIDELRRLRGALRAFDHDGPAGPKGPQALASVTGDQATASEGWRQRALGQMAEFLVSGRLVTEGLEPPENEVDAATVPAEAERFDSDATLGVTPLSLPSFPSR